MLQAFEYFLTVAVLLVWVFALYRDHLARRNRKMLKSFEGFLNILIKQYARSENIQRALEEAGEMSSEDMRKESGKISDMLNEGEHSDAVVHFIRNIKEPFIREFYLLCSSISSFGDTVFEGVSVFERNLRYIKEELRIELLLKDEEDYLFSGLMPLAVIPFFMLKPIENWAVGITSDMKRFYNGSYGIVTLTVCFLVTTLCLWFVRYLKAPGDVKRGNDSISDMILKIGPVRSLLDEYISRHYSLYLRKNEELKKLRGYGNIRGFIIKRILFSILGILISFAFCFGTFGYERKISLRDVSVDEYRVPGMDEASKNMLSEQLSEYFGILIDEGIRDTEAIADLLGGKEGDAISDFSVAVLKERLDEYYNVHFGLVYYIIMLMAGITGFNIPMIMLIMLKWQHELGKQKETLHFQTLILILMHHERITVEEMLRWMEMFARVFVTAFERAVDDYSFRRSEALERLKSDVGYEPLVCMVDCLISCDDITVEKAFADLENERSYNLEQYRQSRFDSLKERAAFSRVVAFLPFIGVLGLRLIVPFVLTGLTQLGTYSGMLGGGYL